MTTSKSPAEISLLRMFLIGLERALTSMAHTPITIGISTRRSEMNEKQIIKHTTTPTRE